MAIVANQTTLTLDASSVGCIRSFAVPSGVVKEVDVTCLDSSIETFQASTLQEAQEMTFTVIFDPSSSALEAGVSGSWLIQFPKDEVGSASGASWAFEGFIRDAGEVSGEYTSDSPLEQTVTVRLSTLVTKTLEA